MRTGSHCIRFPALLCSSGRLPRLLQCLRMKSDFTGTPGRPGIRFSSLTRLSGLSKPFFAENGKPYRRHCTAAAYDECRPLRADGCPCILPEKDLSPVFSLSLRTDWLHGRIFYRCIRTGGSFFIKLLQSTSGTISIVLSFSSTPRSVSVLFTTGIAAN